MKTFNAMYSNRFASQFRRLLSIQTASTPNDNALKFITKGVRLLPPHIQKSTIEIDDLASATEKSPLALQLFKVPGVKSILIGDDFITVNKVDEKLSNSDHSRWQFLKPQIINVIDRSLSKSSEKKVNVLTPQFLENISNVHHDDYIVSQEPLDTDDDVTYEIKELINTRIRPAIQDDGGDVQFRRFDPDAGIVYIKLKGACKSCSLSEDTLKHGIESMLQHYVEEVKEVKAILDPEEEISLKEFEKLEKKLMSRSTV
ncbi:Protein involved in iron metabolism in mitochondria [Komagataella phaffii CBS 7435]|uniref:Protein involved in iron metabolism in mitochondria n=2 Tax=Komagataella phaffii TaxID=460519 RepID=C4QXG5_KOMPG|nr:Protein involved in iron metabolism in mitochondria [Komagataella phaffii GS115]AOA60484.1 GQ67_02075T0 [Komagataella phaffii]CAH2446751.1 Protein involved in iron metabolism in mitochondria [Komagataella phaffii CBS 7435]AOA65426.1 GQ68_02090T0 [Komagataella phaffii GS115]CAY67938.1 Protein involved in iron metabolism in mitochondria [Komagataella phaffii GS115]CCA37016.1 Protein involved in iron metabolism in mitochondria [Komagataella phaffii CBS 7435]